MKKNIMMRLASFLLVAVLISTSAISGTYAKYVTEKSGEDIARVAKWGVQITANGTAFGTIYNQKADGNNITTTYDAATDTVKNGGADSMNLVAPGTTDNMVAMELSGTPEVSVNVSYVAELTLSNWEDADGNEYCPIIFTVNGETYGMSGLGLTVDNGYATVALLEEAVEGAIGAYSKDYPANTDLSVETNVATPDVSWNWPFYISATNDVKDTHLGDVAADIVDGDAATIKLKVTTTVTQID